MMEHLGKIFISHSSNDKPLVRDLAERVNKSGFQVWIDEHDLIAGDAITTKISKAMSDSLVILIVISKASISSKWLKYELNIATERMLKGECRVIPIVIDDAKLPDEIQSILYVDCRKSLDSGWRSILTALQHENQRSVWKKGFRAQIGELIESVFGKSVYCSILGEYKSDNYECVFLPIRDENEDEYGVVYETISSYNINNYDLNELWWDEYYRSTDILSELLHLIITERPISFKLDYNHPKCNKIGVRSTWIESHNIPVRHVVTVDLHQLNSEEERKGVLLYAKELLIGLAETENNRKKHQS